MTAQKRKTVLYTFDCSGCGYCTEVCDSGILKLVDNGTCRFVNVGRRFALHGMRTVRTAMPEQCDFT